MVALAWRRPADPALRSALLVAGAVLAAPYGFEDDLVPLDPQHTAVELAIPLGKRVAAP